MAKIESKNERITENLVRDSLRALKYDAAHGIVVEEQRSKVAAIKKLLKEASKAGGGGQGSPEFLIHSPEAADVLLVIECKADPRAHESGTLDKPAEFAVDGVLHYAKFLSKEFNVVAVAVSGQTKQGLVISSFLWSKAAKEHKALTTRAGKLVEDIVPWDEYVEHASFDREVAKARTENLMAFSRELHEFMRDHAKLTEPEKPLLVSGTLLALRNEPFAKTFGIYKPRELQQQWFSVIEKELQGADIPRAKKSSMTQPYSSIAQHPVLGVATAAYPKGVLHELIKLLHEKVWPFVSVYKDFDVVGQFYGEFLKYTGGDKKALGIVLTPRHITELFARIANVKRDSRVLDLCCGTGGFLIAAMGEMLKDAPTAKAREMIKKKGLVGVEEQPSMYALAASNMILRGDGKANLYQGNCFHEDVVQAVKAHKCSFGMINPPYSQTEAEYHELKFVQQMLNCLSRGGIGIAIVPMACATAPHQMRNEILKHHTLEAVMSMPPELFHPVGVITCIMVFSAHLPHASANKSTWFGYWREDSFTKIKNLGRVDLRTGWPAIRDAWVKSFRDRDEQPGMSVKRKVGPEDEWCAEAYLETDYSRLSRKDFEKEMREYLVFRLMTLLALHRDDLAAMPESSKAMNLGTCMSAVNSDAGLNVNPRSWLPVKIGDLFEIKKGKRLTKMSMRPGTTPFIGAIDHNNGVAARISQAAGHPRNTITVNYNGAGVAEAFYQAEPFLASDDVNVLYPKGFTLSLTRAMFLIPLIRIEKYRFSYGRKWHAERMRDSVMKLPHRGSEVDWNWVDRFIGSLQFSKGIQALEGESVAI